MEPERLGEELSDQDRLLLVFGYLGPLALLSLIASRREFVKWHAKQGLVLSCSLAAVYFVMYVFGFFVDRMWSVFGHLLSVAVWLVVAGVALAALFCVIRALEGERFKLPFLGQLADRL